MISCEFLVFSIVRLYILNETVFSQGLNETNQPLNGVLNV